VLIRSRTEVNAAAVLGLALSRGFAMMPLLLQRPMDFILLR
jgi:hypothetical protein